MIINTDYDFYSDCYGGKLSEDEIMPLLRISDTVVGAMVCGEGDEVIMKRASCIQADFYASCGGYGTGYSSVRIGDFSVSGCGGDISHGVCSAAASLLESAGLLFRGGVRLC